MKKIIILLFGVLMFASCSSSREDEASKKDFLIGNWKAKSLYQIKEGTNVKEDVSAIYPCSLKNTISFSESGYLEAKEYDENGGDCYLAYSDTALYTFDENLMKIFGTTTDGSTGSLDVIELTSSQMILHTESVDYGTESYNVYTVFSKQ